MSDATDRVLSPIEWLNPIIHVDGDAFFTSVEQALNPALRGRPVVTGAERGIVACASYEAKALGIKRPMRLFDARAMCPQLVCLPSDYEAYSLMSLRMFAILRRWTPMVEESSIDEAFADLSGLRRLHRMDFPQMADAIRRMIHAELGLTVSVGLSASKTLAKIASGWNKPNGLTILKANGLHHFLGKVPVEKVCGIGPNTTALLRKLGVHTVLDYVQQPEAWARRVLGKIGSELWHELRGTAMYPLQIQTQPRPAQASVSQCRTFSPSSADKTIVKAQLLQNIEGALMKMRRQRLQAGAATIFLRDHEFQSRGVEASFMRRTSTTLEIVPLLMPLFEQLIEPGRRYRQTGVAFFDLAPMGETQYLLFEDVSRVESLKTLDRVLDESRLRFGEGALQLATSMRVPHARVAPHMNIPTIHIQNIT